MGIGQELGGLRVETATVLGRGGIFPTFEDCHDWEVLMAASCLHGQLVAPALDPNKSVDPWVVFFRVHAKQRLASVFLHREPGYPGEARVAGCLCSFDARLIAQCASKMRT